MKFEDEFLVLPSSERYHLNRKAHEELQSILAEDFDKYVEIRLAANSRLWFAKTISAEEHHRNADHIIEEALFIDEIGEHPIESLETVKYELDSIALGLKQHIAEFSEELSDKYPKFSQSRFMVIFEAYMRRLNTIIERRFVKE